MAPRGRRDILDANISYDMHRLFDPYNFDHIPEGKRLGLFKQRDLPHIKHYKAAVKIFGGPPCRTRVLVAPPMETPLKHRLGLYHNTYTPPSAPVLNGSLKPQSEIIKQPSQEEKAQAAEDEKVSTYKSWINERRKLRNDLENIGLNENFLARKPDKTELEKRVQANYKAVRLYKPETPPPPEVPSPPKPLPEVPTMDVPPPDGLQLLDNFLTLNRMRLMDLFLLADKDKSWSISREELLNAVTTAKIPLTESEVDDIIITLDMDLDDELAYKELNKGLNEWRKQQRELKKQGLENRPPPQINIGSVGRQSKSIEERAQSQEPYVLRGQSRETASKSVRTTSKETQKTAGTPLQKESSSSDLNSKSKSQGEDGSRESSKPAPSQVEVHVSDSETEGKSRETRTKTRDSSSQQMAASRSPCPAGQEDKQSSDTQGSRLVASRDAISRGFISRDAGSHTVTSRDVVSRGVESRDVGSRAVGSRPVASRDIAISEFVTSDTIQLDSQQSKSVYEDMLFSAEETPKVTIRAEDIGEEETVTTSPDSRDKGTSSPQRPGSTKSQTGRTSRQSKASTPNSLEAPEPDLRPETRVPESAEAMLDLRKHDKVVLSRNNIRSGLTKEQRVMFDQLPGVIKIGYKPIDDHCAESTMGGQAGAMVDQFRREKLKEYFLVKTMFEETGVPFTQKALDRVLLHPGDKPTNPMKKRLALPLGPLTDEWSPFNQPKPKKRSKKKRRGMGRISRASVMGGAASGGDSGGEGGKSGVGAARGGNGKTVGFVDDDRSGSGSSKRSYITVEDVYPFAAQVTPKVYKENLSSGRAFITRKVDNWMTFEEYTKYTQHLGHRFQHLGRYSNPEAAWPGFLLDKLRLCMDHDLPQVDGHGRPLANRDSCLYEGVGTGLYNSKGSAVFRQTAQPKRAYPGYNNDLITWPVGENGVRYGTIDEHRVVR